jgi:hypothetical protein
MFLAWSEVDLYVDMGIYYTDTTLDTVQSLRRTVTGAAIFQEAASF